MTYNIDCDISKKQGIDADISVHFYSDSGPSYKIGHGLKLDKLTNTLSVDTVDSAQKDNTLPITSAAVYAAVGNIEVLLGTI